VADEKRNNWDRRKTDRRQTGKIIPLDDNNFEKEMIHIPVFGFVQFNCHWSKPCANQEIILTQIAQDFKDTQKLRVGLFEVTPTNHRIPVQHRIRSIPAMMIFRGGDEVYRKIGCASRASIKKILSEIIANDTREFVERRKGSDYRRGERRYETTLETLMWTNLGKELISNPWPIVLAMNPVGDEHDDTFALLVEAAVESMMVPGLQTLHVFGTPSDDVKKHFDISIHAPGVAVFYQEKLIGQFENIRSVASLAKQIRKVIP